MPSAGRKLPRKESQDVEVAEPFTVGDIALPAGKIFDMAGIDQDHFEAARVENIEDGNPVDARGCHRHVRHRQACSQSASGGGAGEGGERLHRRRVAIGRHRDEVLGGSAVDAGGVRVEPFEGCGRLTGLRGAATGLTLHGGLL